MRTKYEKLGDQYEKTGIVFFKVLEFIKNQQNKIGLTCVNIGRVTK